MRIIYCADPWNKRRPDPAYEAEVIAATEVGLAYSVIDFDVLVSEKTIVKAVRHVEPSPEPTLAIYRGWLLRPAVYQQLYDLLVSKQLYLINTPDAYRHCHYLPESYAVIEGHTPLSVWMKTVADVSFDTIMELLKPFGTKPAIVKDFVKSRKHEWFEACYIPSAADRQVVERVIKRFMELQGEDLNEGLVFREFVNFEQLTTHSKSGMPLTREFRLFFLDGKPVLFSEYWEEGIYGDVRPSIDFFNAIAQNVQSRFFTMDVAQRRDGGWMIIELGDGQVAGLPERADVSVFYRSFATLVQ
ncbi:MAG TPA: ATP-grasp domain-containing protein [Ktedonobacteraceae bacterium]|nr:ATP-grasp domain-containing protein [Ktedonobacteraceae bacterium]